MAARIKHYLFWATIIALASPLVPSDKPIAGLLIRQETLFQIVVEVMAALYLWLLLLDPSLKPKSSRVALAVLAFVGAMGLATIFSDDPARSLFSSRDRMTGYFLLLHLGLFFLITGTIFRSLRERKIFIQATVITSVLVSFYGIGQHLGIFPLPGRITDVNRIFSTFGNPSFLASYLLSHIFLEIFLILTEKRRLWPGVWVAATAFNAVVLFLTGTRGAFIGLFTGLFVVALLAAFYLDQRFRKIGRIGVGVAILLPLLLLGIARLGTFSNNPYFSRISNVSTFWTGGLRNRVLVWEISWKAFQDRPIVGWGPEQFSIGFDKHFNPELVSAAGSPESWFDRSHNVAVDALVMGGIFGILGFFALVGSLCFAAFSLLKGEHERRLLGIAALASIVAYLVQGMFIFDTLGSYLPLFFIAVLLGARDSAVPPHNGNAKQKQLEVHPLSFGRKALLGASCLAVFFSITKYNLAPARAEGLAWHAFSFINQDAAQFKKEWADATSHKTPFERDVWVELTDYLLGNSARSLPPQILKDYLAVAKDEFINIESLYRLDARMYYQAGRMSDYLGALGARDPAFSEKTLMKALALSPSRPDIYYELSEFERLRGNPVKQLDWLDKAVRLDENVSASWWNLGVAYADRRDYRKAVELMEKANKMGYIDWQHAAEAGQLLYLVEVYDAGQGPPERIVEFLERAVALSQDRNPQLYANLAAAYIAVGNKERARWAVGRAVQLNPSFKPDADRFLRLHGLE